MFTEVMLEPDEVLYHQGEIAKDMYFIVSGFVDELTEAGDVETLYQQLRPGNATGDVAFFFKMRYSFVCLCAFGL